MEPEYTGDSATATANPAGESANGISENPTGQNDPVLAAFERAEQQVSGKQPTGDSAPSSQEQAADASADGPDDSASTPSPDDTDTPGPGEDDGTSGPAPGEGHPEQDASTPAEQSLTPPDSWPKERREQFKTLPDTAKTLTLDFYRDMEKGLKQSFDKLANERKQLSDNFGLEADQLKQLAERANSFRTDPAGVISQLAEEAGIDVFFKSEDEQIPDFETQADLVKYLRQQGQQEARQAAANEAKALRQQQHQAEMKQRMEAEFAQAYQAHPDLPDHKDAVIRYISGFNLPVEMAYRLATYEGLAELAQSGQGAKAELDKARAELEKLQKLSTMPPARADAHGHRHDGNGLDPVESAYLRAEKRLGR